LLCNIELRRQTIRSVSIENITETFLSYFGKDTDPRLKKIIENKPLTSKSHLPIIEHQQTE